MRGFTFWTSALAAIMVGQTLASPVAIRPQPVKVTPGGAQDIIITKQDTLNGTFKGTSAGTEQSIQTVAAAASAALPLEIVNNFAGATSGEINAYVTGLDTSGNVVFLQADGSFYYPSGTTSSVPVQITADIGIPISGEGTTTTITIPDYISSGRVYLAVGSLEFFVVDNGSGGAALVQPSAVNPSDPSADVNWGFIELTNTEDGGLYTNISYVDFIGLILGMSLTGTDGSVQSALGLTSDAVSTICADLVAQTASDGQPWASLCQTDTAGNYIRVLSPNDYVSTDSSAFSDYFTDYISEVYSTYSSSPLTINTQTGTGNVTCTTGGSTTFTCEGSDVTFSEPAAIDIFGCNSGPFAVTGNSVDAAIVPRLCAAFNRATLLLSGGDVQPSLGADSYYTVAPCNYYSKFVHEVEVDGKGYAFSYDDVNPDGENASGELVSTIPASLTITVGGPSS